MLEWLPNYGNQKTAQDSTYIKGDISEINDINEWPEVIPPINLKNWPISTEIPHPIG